jgi:hypothetical protein
MLGGSHKIYAAPVDIEGGADFLGILRIAGSNAHGL